MFEHYVKFESKYDINLPEDAYSDKYSNCFSHRTREMLTYMSISSILYPILVNYDTSKHIAKVTYNDKLTIYNMLHSSLKEYYKDHTIEVNDEIACSKMYDAMGSLFAENSLREGYYIPHV